MPIAPTSTKAVDKDLMAMKMDELKQELKAWDEVKTGNKAWLRRRLYAAIYADAAGGNGELAAMEPAAEGASGDGAEQSVGRRDRLPGDAPPQNGLRGCAHVTSWRT